MDRPTNSSWASYTSWWLRRYMVSPISRPLPLSRSVIQYINPSNIWMKNTNRGRLSKPNFPVLRRKGKYLNHLNTHVLWIRWRRSKKINRHPPKHTNMLNMQSFPLQIHKKSSSQKQNKCEKTTHLKTTLNLYTTFIPAFSKHLREDHQTCGVVIDN